MSWSRGGNGGWGGASMGAAIQVNPLARTASTLAPATAGTPATLDPMRDLARQAYGRGQVGDAIQLQRQVIEGATATGQLRLDDILFHGLLLYASGQVNEGIAVLRAGLDRFPGTAALHENIAVFLLSADQPAEAIEASEEALRLGSDSPNVHDCIADAAGRIGRPDLAIRAGRAALEAKDRRFGAYPVLAQVPERPPPAFNPHNEDENVIAYTLWGNEPRYLVPLMENARIRPHLFPTWRMRVYHDASVDASYLASLAGLGVDLRPSVLPSGQPPHRRLLWRFEVIADPTVKRFLCRDADSLLSVKERVAVDAWLASDRWFHTMRDWYTHTDLILAGMWGGVGGALPAVPTLLAGYKAWRMEHDHVDQDLLSETVWPIVRDRILIHDSTFAPCLGSVPFPPFGAPPPGSHVGQNAFLHFQKSG